MSCYVLDTNIITAILKRNEKVKEKIKEKIIEGKEIYINGISYYEIKRGLLAVNAKSKLVLFDDFCNRFGLLLLDSKSIYDKASEIYVSLKKKGKLIGDADILIAAIVYMRNSILVTDNVRHFENIHGLKLENWLS